MIKVCLQVKDGARNLQTLQLELDDSTTFIEILEFVKEVEKQQFKNTISLPGNASNYTIYFCEKQQYIHDLEEQIGKNLQPINLIITKKFNIHDMSAWKSYIEQKEGYLAGNTQLGDKLIEDTILKNIQKDEEDYKGSVKLTLIVKQNGESLFKIQTEIDANTTIEILFDFLKDSYSLIGDIKDWRCYSEKREKYFEGLMQKIGLKFPNDTLIIETQQTQQHSQEQRKLEKIEAVHEIINVQIILKKENEDIQLQLELDSSSTVKELFKFLSDHFSIAGDSKRWTCYSTGKGSYYNQDQEIGGEFTSDILIVQI